jgi:hypothetical protein
MTESAKSQPHQNPILRMLAAFFPFLFRSRQHLNEAEREQSFLLQVVQPALVGLMDGSVSTLAPIFATAYATNKPHTTFLVGVAAAVGAGISMAFAEGLSDDGELTGRGHPIQLGVIFLISDIHLALLIAYVVVAVELAAISLIRFRFFKMPIAKSTIQVVVGGALVFIAGILIGSA